MNDEIINIVKSVFESRYLKRIPRAGTTTLLGNEVTENIAEHSFYTTLWALVICHLEPKLDPLKVLTMSVIHDLEEVRTGDQHLISSMYLKKTEVDKSAFTDMWKGSALGELLTSLHNERLDNQSPESRASRDADLLAQLVTEKEYQEKGNKEAQEWMEFTLQRITTETGKTLAHQVMQSRMTEWWEEIKNQIREKHGIAKKSYE